MNTPLETIKEMYQAFGQGDIETFIASVPDNLVWESHLLPGIPMHGTYHGKAGVQQWIMDVANTVEVVNFQPEQFLGNGRTVVVTGKGHARRKDNGIEYHNDWVHVHEFTNGALTRTQMFNNVASVAEAYK